MLLIIVCYCVVVDVVSGLFPLIMIVIDRLYGLFNVNINSNWL